MEHFSLDASPDGFAGLACEHSEHSKDGLSDRLSSHFLIQPDRASCAASAYNPDLPYLVNSHYELKKQEGRISHEIEGALVKLKEFQKRADRFSEPKAVIVGRIEREKRNGDIVRTIGDLNMPVGATFSNGFLRCEKPLDIRGVGDARWQLPWNEFPCGQCKRCKANRKITIHGRLLAQACQSTHMIAVTLTYDPKLYPDARERHEPLHIVGFQVKFRRWIKDAYRKAGRPDPAVKISVAREGGPMSAEPEKHCHYHVVAFVEGELQHGVAGLLDPKFSCENGSELPSELMGIRKGYVPPNQFKAVLADPNVLLWPDPNHSQIKARELRQNHRIWKWGSLSVDICGNDFRPFDGAVVKYVTKYVTKSGQRFRLPKECGQRAAVANAFWRGRNQQEMEVPYLQVQGYRDIRHSKERLARSVKEGGGFLAAPRSHLQKVPVSGKASEMMIKAHLRGWRHTQKKKLRAKLKAGKRMTIADVRAALKPPESGFLAARRLAYKKRRDRWAGPLARYLMVRAARQQALCNRLIMERQEMRDQIAAYDNLEAAIKSERDRKRRYDEIRSRAFASVSG